MKWNVFGFTHYKLWLQSNEKWLQKNVIKITKYVHVLLYYFFVMPDTVTVKMGVSSDREDNTDTANNRSDQGKRLKNTL